MLSPASCCSRDGLAACRWRRMRRIAHEALTMKNAPKYHPIQQYEAIILVNDLINNPYNWSEHLQR